MSIPRSQINEINRLLLAYAAGKYYVTGKISKNRDEIDTIIAGVNMLGEELLETTVSRDHFSSIYNAVADMVFVVSAKGHIEDTNAAARNLLGYDGDSLSRMHINEIIAREKVPFFNKVKKMLPRGAKSALIETMLVNKDKALIHVSCSCSRIIDKNNKFKGYLIIAEDITERVMAEKKILRTIVDTQEKEQKRVAGDLHDSLGADLSSLKLMLSALYESMPSLKEKQKEGFEACNSILGNALANIRSICFNMMPGSIENGGIGRALEELTSRFNTQNYIRFNFKKQEPLPGIDKRIEITIYRIAQEFINNSIRHGETKKIGIKLSHQNGNVIFALKDDGKGFKLSDEILQKGLGLRNMRSRVNAFNGTFELSSKINQGTRLKISFPATL